MSLNSEQIQAIYQLYPNVVRTAGDDAFDEEGNLVQYDLQAVNEKSAKDECKQKASSILYATDWTTIPDVASSLNSPYLANQADFLIYRNEIRKLAVNPVVDPVWPTPPQPNWM